MTPVGSHFSFAHFVAKILSRQIWHYAYKCLPTGVSRETYRLSGRYQCIQISFFLQISKTSGINPFVFVLRSAFAVMKSYALVMNTCFTTEPGCFLIILPMYDSFLLSMIDSIVAQPIKPLAISSWVLIGRDCIDLATYFLYSLDFTQICRIQGLHKWVMAARFCSKYLQMSMDSVHLI